jgi:hypothetical protein
MNKLAPERFDALVEATLAIPISTAATLRAVIDLIFDKAVAEPAFGPMYAEVRNMAHTPGEHKRTHAFFLLSSVVFLVPCFLSALDRRFILPIDAVVI